ISHVEHNSVLNRSNGLKVLILGARSLVQKTYGIGLTASTVTYRDPWENTIENELRDYARYLRQFAAIAASDQIGYYFVLQPSAAYKEFSEEEKRVVTHADYKRQYDLVDAMFYKTAGDHYLSLKDLFQHESRQIFYDDAHMNLARHLAYGGKEISYGQQKVA